MKSLTNSENPYSNPLQEACTGFQVAACDSRKLIRKSPAIMKIVLKAGCDIYTTNDSEGKLEQKLLFGFFKKAKDLIIIFLFHKAAWKFKNHLRMYRKF